MRAIFWRFPEYAVAGGTFITAPKMHISGLLELISPNSAFLETIYIHCISTISEWHVILSQASQLSTADIYLAYSAADDDRLSFLLAFL